MENKLELGMNRTGLDMAPLMKNELIGFARSRCNEAPLDDGSYQAMQSTYVQEADRIGAVPIPATLTGLAATGISKLAGKRPEVLVDKLGERLAFERTGVRLYDALIRKCTTLASLSPAAGADAANSVEGIAVGTGAGTLVDLATLAQIRTEEANHFQLVQRALESMGADPTAVTPCADTAGVMASGLLQIITDPRTTVPQCLNAILTAELSDNAAWDLLVELARQLDHTRMAEEFESALVTERGHISVINSWLRTAVIGEAS